jgi:hypothetical protein
MSLAICGLATARPAQAIDQQAAVEIAQTFLRGERDARGLSALFRRTQVRTRGSVILAPPQLRASPIILLGGGRPGG